MNRADRMVRTLRYLADHGGSADSSEIREGVPAYIGESGHRQWRRDLAELRSRGLVAPKRSGEEMSSRVDQCPLVKPQRLFLTLAEHDVLAEVEDRLRPCLVPSPLPEGTARGLGDLARLTRFLEERPGRKLKYAQVEQALGLSRDRLTALLRQIVAESEYDGYLRDYTRQHPALEWIRYCPPDDEDPDGYVASEEAAEVLGEALAATFDPHERSGQLGFWAYSAAETDDRLAVIGRALAGPGLSAPQRRCLRSARRKLGEWRTLLPPG